MNKVKVGDTLWSTVEIPDYDVTYGVVGGYESPRPYVVTKVGTKYFSFGEAKRQLRERLGETLYLTKEEAQERIHAHSALQQLRVLEFMHISVISLEFSNKELIELGNRVQKALRARYKVDWEVGDKCMTIRRSPCLNADEDHRTWVESGLTGEVVRVKTIAANGAASLLVKINENTYVIEGRNLSRLPPEQTKDE